MKSSFSPQVTTSSRGRYSRLMGRKSRLHPARDDPPLCGRGVQSAGGRKSLLWEGGGVMSQVDGRDCFTSWKTVPLQFLWFGARVTFRRSPGR